jgi:hypothetical protein
VKGAAGWSIGSAQPSPPRLPASPYPGVEGRYRQAGTTLMRPSPHLPPPQKQLAGWLGGGGPDQQQLSTPTAEPQLSWAAPSWASVVRDGVHSRRPPQPSQLPTAPASETVSKEDFIALYKRCVHAVLKARVALRYAAGRHEVSLTCYLPTSPSFPAPAVRRRCRCHRRRDQATTAATAPVPVNVNLPLQTASAVGNKAPETNPALLPPTAPAPAPTSSSLADPPQAEPSYTSPPTKRTRKAAKRRCEVELLRSGDEDGELHLSTLSCVPGSLLTSPSPIKTLLPKSPAFPPPTPSPVTPTSQPASPMPASSTSPSPPPSLPTPAFSTTPSPTPSLPSYRAPPTPQPMRNSQHPGGRFFVRNVNVKLMIFRIDTVLNVISRKMLINPITTICSHV